MRNGVAWGKRRACRPAAYELFTSQLPKSWKKPIGWCAAVAVSMHEFPDANPDEVDRTLKQIADEISGRVISGNQHALVAQLHAVLFDELGFTGNTESYYAPENSYLPKVLHRAADCPSRCR